MPQGLDIVAASRTVLKYRCRPLTLLAAELLAGPSGTATTVVACGLPGPHHHSVSCPLTAVGRPRPRPSSLIAPASPKSPVKITALARCRAGSENHTPRTVLTSCGQPTVWFCTGNTALVTLTSAIGSTGSSSGANTSALMPSPPTNRYIRDRRAASQPSSATAPAASKNT